MNGVTRRTLESALMVAGFEEKQAIRIVKIMIISKELTHLRMEIFDTTKYLGVSGIDAFMRTAIDVYHTAEEHPRMRSERIALYCMKRADEYYTNRLYQDMPKFYTKPKKPLRN